jgi:hypothetical protein
MVARHTVISFERFVQDFDSLFRHRVFRLEALDRYDAPNERKPYARFLAGQPADLAWREPWKRLVRDVRASGRIMQRVHIVTEPVSDYVRFELLRVYPANVEAGEDVRILARQPAERVGITFRDFWLFDDGLAALFDYDDDGRVQCVQTTDRPPALERMRRERSDALALAVPLTQYVAEHNITEGK